MGKANRTPLSSDDETHHLDGPSVTVSLRVRYAETDQMGVAHHAAYFVWFELARTELCRARGVDYAQMERDGMILPIVEAQCRYIAPARYDELLSVRATVVSCRRGMLKIEYHVLRDDRSLATAETKQILLDRESGRPRRFASSVIERFRGAG